MSKILHEEWRPVVGYEGLYEVSNKGKVQSLTRLVEQKGRYPKIMKGRILKPHFRNKNYSNTYLAVRLSKNSRTTSFNIHTLVAEAFIGPRPEELQVCHGALGKYENSIDNLSYGTARKNAEDRDRDGTTARGSKNPKAKLTEEEVFKIKQELKQNKSITDLSKKYSVNKCTISDIKNNKTWKHVC